MSNIQLIQLLVPIHYITFNLNNDKQKIYKTVNMEKGSSASGGPLQGTTKQCYSGHHWTPV